IRAARIHSSSCELPQRLQVVVVELTQIGDAVAQHGQALDAHTECIAGVFAAVDTDRCEYVGVDHAAAEHFQPAVTSTEAAAINVDFRGRFGKREIGWAKTQLQISFEKCIQE